ncbi:Tigger transposable element-derived protein 6 [Dictyocoela muelleri]|nr:Tigger transposable element-derived protein 6 [Dictyocoela muelleri]
MKISENKIKTNRKRNTFLTIKEKHSLIKFKKENPKFTQEEIVKWICKNFDKSINRTTVSKILKKFKCTDNFFSHQKKQRTVKFTELENKLLTWFIDNEMFTVLTDSMIKEKARDIANELNIGPDVLQFSDGWLSKFKKRHNISRKNMHGESASVNLDDFKDDISDIKKEIALYDQNDVFNFDETCLFYRMEPDKTLATKKVNGRKKSKERITIGLCVNSTGSEKITPLVIGKSAKPRALKNINLKNLGIDYYSNKCAWMTASIFKSWLKNFNNFITSKLNFRKVLLLIDNATSHKFILNQYDNIKILFLPPNTTSKIQPLDAGIIANFKVKYKFHLVRFLLKNLIKKHSERKNIDILEAIRYVVSAWEQVKPEVIKNCWKHTNLILLECEKSKSDISDIVKLSKSINELGFENPFKAHEYLNIENELAIPLHYDPINIEKNECTSEFDYPINIEKNEYISEFDDPKQTEIRKEEICISYIDAMNSATNLMNYMEQQKSNFIEEIKSLKHIRNKIEDDFRNSMRQTSLLFDFKFEKK